MEELSKYVVTGLILCLLCSCCGLCKHNRNEDRACPEDNDVTLSGGDEPACFDSIFQSVKNVAKYASLTTNRNNQYKDLLQQNDRVNKWVSKVDSNRITIFTLGTRSDEYLILCSQQAASTGLASTFYDWLLIYINEGTVIQDGIKSLSQDGRSWFIKNDTIHFILLKYGNDFYHNDHNYDNLSLDIVEYIVDGDAVKEFASSNIICSGE